MNLNTPAAMEATAISTSVPINPPIADSGDPPYDEVEAMIIFTRLTIIPMIMIPSIIDIISHHQKRLTASPILKNT